MKEIDFSSDPNTSSDSYDEKPDENNEPAEDPVVPIKEKEIKKDKTHYVTMFFLDFLVPICLILNAISVLSIMGMLIILIFIIHTLILNFSRSKTTGIKIILAIEFVISIVILVFSVMKKIDHIAIELLGLDFNNCVSTEPTFAFVVSIITIVMILVTFILLSKSSFHRMRKARVRLYSSVTYLYVIYALWYFFMAFCIAAAPSYLSAPLIIYFLYTSITISTTGKTKCSKNLEKLIYLYTVLYSLFLIYQVSSIGEKYVWRQQINFKFVAPRNVYAVLGTFSVLLGYITVQLMTSPGANEKKLTTMTPKLGLFIDILLLIGFAGSFFYGLYYPCYISILWVLIPVISAFFSGKIIKKFFFKLLTIIFTLSFFAIDVASNGSDWNYTPSQHVRDTGLFNFKDDFNFTIIGFVIVAFLTQVGRLVNLPSSPDFEPSSEDSGQIAASKDSKEGKIPNEEESDSNLVEDEKELEKKMKEEKKRLYLHKIKKIGRRIKREIENLLKGICLAAIIIIGIIGGFYENKWIYMVFSTLCLIIVLLGLFHKWTIILLQILSSIMILANAFFAASSMDFPSWIDNFDLIGLRPSSRLIEYTWTAYAVMFLCAILAKIDGRIVPNLSPFVSAFFFFLISAFHFIYVFVYDTNIFSVIYLALGTLILSCQILNNRKFLVLWTMFSSIMVSLQIVILMLSHMSTIRNLIVSAIPYRSIIDISKTEEPSLKIAMLAFILFLSAISFRSRPVPPATGSIANIMLELKTISQNFCFYISWIFAVGFGCANYYPTFIKFLLNVCFLFGSASAKMFIFIRKPFYVFVFVFMIAQFCFHVFQDFISGRFAEVSFYVGLFLDNDKDPSFDARNGAIGWQLALVFITVLNFQLIPPHPPDEEFENKVYMRVFNGFCAMLHNWLPIIVQISLCISSLYNPSIFGWISFIVLMIVVFKESALAKGALIVTILFNICFVIQYLLWLGCPRFLFDFRIDEIINSYGKFLGIVDVTTMALITNCISAFIFTFYLQYHLMYVDYPARFEAIPEFMKVVLRHFIAYNFEIFFTIIIIVASIIPSFDGFIFFVIMACLFVSVILWDFSISQTINMMTIYTFIVIAARMLSRVPCFTDLGIGEVAKLAFDLPLQESSTYESLWIVIFVLERIMVHLMSMDLYKEEIEKRTKRQAYRFLHSRQIAVINKLDQEAISIKRDQQIEQTSQMSSDNIGSIGDSMNRLITQNELRATELKLELQQKRTIFDFLKKKIIFPVVDHAILVLAETLPLECETGLNILTLETINLLMKKIARNAESNKEYVPDTRERKFFSQIPPGVLLHFDTLGNALGQKYFKEEQRWSLLLRYVLMLFRRIAIPLFYLMAVIYFFMKPYLYSVILMIFIFIWHSSRIHNNHILYRVLMIFILFIMGIRSLTNVKILSDVLKSVADSVTVQQMSISALRLFDLDPNSSSTIECFLFLFAVFYLLDQLSYCKVFPPKYYNEKFRTLLPGFPDEYCYGIIPNPEHVLALDAMPTDGFVDRFVESFKKIGLRESVHRLFILLFDIISFIVLLLCWGKWSAGTNEAAVAGMGSTDIQTDAVSIIIWIIHVLFMFFNYFSMLSDNYIFLFFGHNIWFIYTILMSAFYVHSQNRGIPGDLKFYLVLRIFTHLLYMHKCQLGTIFVTFKYPDFASDYNYITWSNKFMRICPFAFEIQVLLTYMSQKTYVSLSDFFIINDVKSNLEIMISQQMNPKKPDKYEEAHYLRNPGLLLFLLLVLMFGPIFFMTESKANEVNNKPISVSLELGFSTLPPIWKSYGYIAPLTSDQQQQLANSRLGEYQPFVLVPSESMSVLYFTRYSLYDWNPSNPDMLQINRSLLDFSLPLVPYFKYNIVFERPTSIGKVPNIEYEYNFDQLTTTQREEMIQSLTSSSAQTINIGINLPLTLLMPTSSQMLDFSQYRQSISLMYKNITGVFWELEFDSIFSNIPFLRANQDSYKCLLYSQPVEKEQDESGGLGIGGVYILIIIIFGVVLRDKTIGQIDSLWIERMEKPQKLYLFFVANDSFRSAHQLEKEKDMTETILDTLKSKEKCMLIGSREA